MKKIKDVLPQSKLYDAYHALFESHLRYGNVAWGSISSSELHELQRFQDRALSIIERARFKDQWPKNGYALRILFALTALLWYIRL